MVSLMSLCRKSINQQDYWQKSRVGRERAMCSRPLTQGLAPPAVQDASRGVDFAASVVAQQGWLLTWHVFILPLHTHWLCLSMLSFESYAWLKTSYFRLPSDISYWDVSLYLHCINPFMIFLNIYGLMFICGGPVGMSKWQLGSNLALFHMWLPACDSACDSRLSMRHCLCVGDFVAWKIATQSSQLVFVCGGQGHGHTRWGICRKITFQRNEKRGLTQP